MGNFVIDMIVNMYESFAGFALFFAIYRFPIKSMIPLMVLSAFIMAQSSYVMRFILNLDDWTALLMLLWMIILLKLLFRTHLFYSIMMAVSGFLAYALIQSLLLLLFPMIGLDFLTYDFSHEKVVQVVSSTIALLIVTIMSTKKIGFHFIPDRNNVTVSMRGLNFKLLIALLAAGLTCATFAHLLYSGTVLTLCIAIALSALLLIVVILANRKENQSTYD